MAEFGEVDIIYRESKWIADDELLGIAFSSDGSYSAYSLIVGEGKKNWSGGTTPSGTSYKNAFILTQSQVVDFPIKIEISNDNVRVYLFGEQI